MKRIKMNADYAKVQARLGATTGKSKGYQKPPKPEVSVRPTGGLKALKGKGGLKGTIKITW